MGEDGGGTAPCICLVCFLLSFGTINSGVAVVSAAERKLLLQVVEQNTEDPWVGSYKPNGDDIQSSHKNGSRHLKGTPSPPPPPPTIPKQVNRRNGTTWCIAKPSTSQEKLDEIIGYCCTQRDVDCKVIQAGGMCYFPPNKVSDASVVMNIYYKLNGKHPFDCYFKGSGLIITADPSVGKCIYQA